jgi:hypothetical protein
MRGCLVLLPLAVCPRIFRQRLPTLIPIAHWRAQAFFAYLNRGPNAGRHFPGRKILFPSLFGGLRPENPIDCLLPLCSAFTALAKHLPPPHLHYSLVWFRAVGLVILAVRFIPASPFDF